MGVVKINKMADVVHIQQIIPLENAPLFVASSHKVLLMTGKKLFSLFELHNEEYKKVGSTNELIFILYKCFSINFSDKSSDIMFTKRCHFSFLYYISVDSCIRGARDYPCHQLG